MKGPGIKEQLESKRDINQQRMVWMRNANANSTITLSSIQPKNVRVQEVKKTMKELD